MNKVAAVNTNANSDAYLRSENAYTFAQNSDLADDLTPSGKEAREIVGKTVSESKLWQKKIFDERLRKLMGSDYATMKKFWNTETPVKKFGDFLMMAGCEMNNCAENQYVIFIDLGVGRINVIHISKEAVREWHAQREIEYLPPPFEEELKKLKSRE
ncbi:MAG: hypothetical protein IT173_18755 [Acidobacteria bacterium]|nr:hypothetical protein [Acidobacteriota bacterium]